MCNSLYIYLYSERYQMSYLCFIFAFK